jgi:hypothetical protein
MMDSFKQMAPAIFAVALGEMILGHTLPANASPGDSSTNEYQSEGDPNKERRDWMNRGNAEYVQKNWEAARDAYRRSWDIKHHYTIAANLADVEVKMGHYAEAAAYLKYVLANLPENKGVERKAAEEQLLECRNHLTVVRVATDVADATVLVDGRDVGQTPLRDELLLEPGKHVISVAKPGYGETTKELSAEGSRVELTLTLEKASATPGAQSQAGLRSPPPQTPTIPTKSHSNGYRIGSYVGFGIGAVGVGVGTLMVLKARSGQLDADNQYSGCFPHCSSAQKASIYDSDQRAQHQRTAGAASYIIGGAALVTGATLLVLDSKREAAPVTTATVRPWVGLGQVGLLGSF